MGPKRRAVLRAKVKGQKLKPYEERRVRGTYKDTKKSVK